jgi:hypothetical protein
MQIALAVTLVLFAAWFALLRPKPTTQTESAAAPAQTTQAPAGGAAPGTAGLTRAVDKARGAATTGNGDATRAERTGAAGAAPARPASGSQPTAATGAGSRAAAMPTEPQARPGVASAPRRAANSRVRTVKAALRDHRAVAIAFVDPRTADARAVAGEIRHVSRFGGRAVTLAVPLASLSDYEFITKSVEVTVAPTVVIVDPRRRATTIVGFADRGEIEQRLADALAVKPRR